MTPRPLPLMALAALLLLPALAEAKLCRRMASCSGEQPRPSPDFVGPMPCVAQYETYDCSDAEHAQQLQDETLRETIQSLNEVDEMARRMCDSDPKCVRIGVDYYTDHGPDDNGVMQLTKTDMNGMFSTAVSCGGMIAPPECQAYLDAAKEKADQLAQAERDRQNQENTVGGGFQSFAAPGGDEPGGENNPIPLDPIVVTASNDRGAGNGTPTLPDRDQPGGGQGQEQASGTGQDERQRQEQEREEQRQALNDTTNQFVQNNQDALASLGANFGGGPTARGRGTAGSDASISFSMGEGPKLVELENGSRRAGEMATGIIRGITNQTLTHQVLPDAGTAPKMGGTRVCPRDQPNCL